MSANIVKPVPIAIGTRFTCGINPGYNLRV